MFVVASEFMNAPVIVGTDVLNRAGFSINLKKSSFLSSEIEYLGRTISEGQVPSREKVKALTDADEPQNVKQVRQFMA